MPPRTLLLAVPFLLTLVAPATAQTADDRPRATVGQKALMGLGGHAGGGLLTLAVIGATSSLSDAYESETGLILLVGLYPLGVAVASYHIGQAFGTAGTFRGTLGGAYLGAGLGLLAAGALVSHARFDGVTLEEAIGVVAVGATVYVGGTVFGAVRGYDASVQPTALRSVEGAWAPGLRLVMRF